MKFVPHFKSWCADGAKRIHCDRCVTEIKDFSMLLAVVVHLFCLKFVLQFFVCCMPLQTSVSILDLSTRLKKTHNGRVQEHVHCVQRKTAILPLCHPPPHTQ